jgi:hypothetical protein
VLDSRGQVVGMLDAIAKDGAYECFIISGNLIWEALQMTSPAHPNGFVTGVTKGLKLSQTEG